MDYSDHTTKIPVSYFAEKPADLPPIEHEDVIILLGASVRPKEETKKGILHMFFSPV